MGGDHRPHAQARHEGPHLRDCDAVRGGGAHHLSERAAQLLVAALHLGLAALAHRGVLLRDGEQLEPCALRLNGSRDQLGDAPATAARRAARLELRLVDANHLYELLEEEAGYLLQVLSGAGSVGARGASLTPRGRAGSLRRRTP